MKTANNNISRRTSLTRKVNSGLMAGLLVLLSAIQTLHAEDILCRVQPGQILNQNLFSPDGKMHLSADSVSISEDNISSFSGNVIIQQKESRIETDQAIYNKQAENVNATGNISFLSPSIRIKGETARFDLKSDQAHLSKSEYQSLTSRARGNASEIEVLSKDLVELQDATYTTCDPGNSDWLLSASNISLNKKTHQGSASNVVLRFKDVPFFYFPYLRFPLGEERLSGLLFPSFGHSDEHGSELKIPYYWNIHPQVDATITPWYMSKRGTMLQTELRYLTENNRGTLNTEFLGKDKLVNDKRARVHWLHQATPVLGWNANAEYNYVSDNNYLADFTNDLYSTSTTHLIRTGNLAYNSTDWLLNIKAEDYQVLSGTKPYKRLPQVTLNSRFYENDNALNYNIESEYVRFDHTDNVVIGERLHIKPIISYPLRSAAGFLIPRLSLQHTSYTLQQTTTPLKMSRTVPTFSLDSGLFFERDSSFFNDAYIQTLEPQLFYLYVPYKDQSGLPVFDTSDYAFNLNNPFTETRFNSIDRIGDDNRLTTALTTRFLKQKNGDEVFMARVGQVHYFADRKVQLSGIPVATSSYSNLIAEIKTQPGNWSLSSQAEWDPKRKASVSSSNQLGYHYRDKFALALAHRYQLDTLETREMSMNWKLNTRWQLSAAHLYDLRDKHIVENLFGVNYESCCWGLKLSAKERFLTTTKTDHGVYLELILKGLGGFGFQQ